MPRFKLERLLNQGKAIDLSRRPEEILQYLTRAVFHSRPSRQKDLAPRHHRRAASPAGP